MEGHDPTINTPNEYLASKISSLVGGSQVDDEDTTSRTELDSHANMVVLGRNCFVFDGIHGKTCDVEPFDPALGTAKKIPVVDAAISYDCPYLHQTFILILRNSLYIPTLKHNLVPPFILREAGLTVNDTPKIHVPDPDTSDHSITFPTSNLRIPLQLWVIFSYFPSRTTTDDEIENSDKNIITPDGVNWDPYSTHFAINEDSLTDDEGMMRPKKIQKKHVLDAPPPPVPVTDFDSVVDSVAIGAYSANDTLKEHTFDPGGEEGYVDTSLLDFANALNEEVEISKFKMSIGSTVVNDHISSLLSSGEPIITHVDSMKGEIDAAMASRPTAGVTSQFLSKIWNIKSALAARTLDQSTQLQRQGGDNDLSRMFSTNDRMLRYRRIDSQFFTDTFFATSSGKSTRGFTCAQMFVSDKGFVAIYPMKSKGDFLDALHQFCKEVGVPVTLVVDPSGEQTKKSVKRFCHQVGTTLRILEESTQ